MSGRPSKTYSPSNSPKSVSVHTTTGATQTTASSTPHQDLTETPQSTAEQSSLTPVIVITESPTSHTPTPDSIARQNRPLAIRCRSEPSSKPQPQGQNRSSRLPEDLARSRQEPTTRIAMSSSGSSPSGTSTAGSNSGSGQLPYAPFPYPMPANPRGGSGQGGK
jgi:hypothetical protein